MNWYFWKKRENKVLAPVFRPLTPTDEARDVEAYSSALDFALKHKDVRNIAVTGIYGAGKSSFLRTYFKGRKDVLWVSLASFLGGETPPAGSAPCAKTEEEEEGSPQTVKTGIKDEHLLEVSILQQIFYAEEQSKLPFSRLRRTTGISWGRYLSILGMLGMLCIGLFGVFQPAWFNGYLGEPLHRWLLDRRMFGFWISLGILIVLICRGVWESYRIVKRIRLRRIAVKGVEMELGQKGDESILNRNLDDILYFFESTAYRTVVFEDIDRFNEVDIFTKIREINLILNGAKQIPAKRKPIRFIYALREDLFGDRKEKVKFFDFILPIVPVINASNSRDVLTTFLAQLYTKDGDEKAGQEKAREFYDIIRDISPFLSDMRLVENICNEFAVYKDEIPPGVDHIRLFGMVVFKNFFPGDFAKLHSDQGILVDLIGRKESLLLRRREALENEIKTKMSRIESIRNEEETNLDRLYLPYVGAFLLHIPDSAERFVVHGSPHYLPRIAQDRKMFDALRSDSVQVPYGYGRVVDWKKIENEVDPLHSYDERVTLIKEKAEGKIKVLQEDVARLRKELSGFWDMSLFELAHEGLMDEFDMFDSPHLNSRDGRLLRTLVSEGYIDEQYRLYISVFHETPGERSSQDYRFEIDVMQGRQSPWSTQLPHPETVFENLGVWCFETQAVFNFALFAEALRNYDQKTDCWIHQLAKNDHNARRFVGEFLLQSELSLSERTKLLRELEKKNPKYVEETVGGYFESSAYDKRIVDPIVGLFLRARYNESAKNIPDNVRQYFEEEPGIGRVIQCLGLEDIGELPKFLSWGDFELSDLTDNSLLESTVVFNLIVNAAAFRLSRDNLKAILVHRDEDDFAFNNRNYSTIRNCGIPAVLDLVNREFDNYLDIVYNRLSLSQMDPEDVVVELLNREEFSIESKGLFLAKQSIIYKVEEADRFTGPDALKLALKYGLVEPSWQNVVFAYDQIAEPQAILEFVTTSENFQCLSAKDCHLPWEEVHCLVKCLAEQKDISEESLSKLFCRIQEGTIDDYSGTAATPARIQFLYRAKRIVFSIDLYERLKSNGNGSETTLAALGYKDMDKALASGELSLSDDELDSLLKSGLLSPKTTVMVLCRFVDRIVDNEDLSPIAARLISNDNYRKLTLGLLDACLEYLRDLPLQCNAAMLFDGNATEVRTRLAKFPEPMSRLSKPGSKIVVPKGVSREFIDYLKEHEVVSSVSEDNGELKVHTKFS